MSCYFPSPNLGSAFSIVRRMLAPFNLGSVATVPTHASYRLNSSLSTVQLGGHFSTLLRLPTPGSGSP